MQGQNEPPQSDDTMLQFLSLGQCSELTAWCSIVGTRIILLLLVATIQGGQRSSCPSPFGLDNNTHLWESKMNETRVIRDLEQMLHLVSDIIFDNKNQWFFLFNASLDFREIVRLILRGVLKGPWPPYFSFLIPTRNVADCLRLWPNQDKTDFLSLELVGSWTFLSLSVVLDKYPLQ